MRLEKERPGTALQAVTGREANIICSGEIIRARASHQQPAAHFRLARQLLRETAGLKDASAWASFALAVHLGGPAA